MNKTETAFDFNPVQKIKTLMNGLTQERDNAGNFCFELDGKIIDDKSWKSWNWPQGVALYGLLKYAKQSQDQNAYQIIEDWYAPYLSEDFQYKNVNSMAPVLALATIYEETKDKTILPHLENWAKWSMNKLSRTQFHGFQHDVFEAFNTEELWDDTLMMAVLALAKIGVVLDKPEYIHEAERQFLVHAKFLMDEKTGLWYHGWSFLRKDHFGSVFWGRGNCWITIAIPEFIEIVAERLNEGIRDYLSDILNYQVQSIQKYQNSEGLWHTILDDPTSYIEISAALGFIYGINKGIELNILDSKFKEVSDKALKATNSYITEDGRVLNVSAGTPMGLDKDFYKNIVLTDMPYGPSLAILALTTLL